MQAIPIINIFCVTRHNKQRFYLFVATIVLTLAKPIQLQTTSTTTTPSQTTTTTPSSPLSNLSESSLVLGSSSEFVDYTETPSLLYDNADDNTEPLVSSAPAESNKNNSTSQTTTPITIQTISTTYAPIVSTTNAPKIVEDLATSNENDESTDNEDVEDSTSDYFRPPQNVSHYMDYIERLFTDLRHQVKDLLEPHMPQLIRSSSRVSLSQACSYDVLRFALALRSFEPWALKSK